MRIPSRHRGQWAAELIHDCSVSRAQRIQRGIAYRNLFLTGSENGVPQTFLRTHDFILDLLAVLYSPSDLRFTVDFFGQVSPVERAKGVVAAAILHQHIGQAEIDDACGEAALWSLIKGKAIQQIVWSRQGLESYLIQPEAFGVYNESISSLERQEAFVHTTFPTRSKFRQMIYGLPEARQKELMAACDRLTTRGREGDDSTNVLKQIIVGGLYPYATQGSPAGQSGGQITHLFAPQATMPPAVVDSLVPMEELWVWNEAQDDWCTITMVGEEIVFGEDQLFNAFSSQYPVKDEKNPLNGKHGFIEFCPMPLDQNFWGLSFVYLVALLQRSMNNRIDGINTMLRKEEDPPRFASGTMGINQNAYAKLNKPGGYFTDGSPNAKIQDIVKEIPTDLWKSLHELNQMFDQIAGMPPMMRGEAEGSVRSQGQSDAMIRMGGARHKNPALKLERSVERTGALCLDILRAKTVDIHTAWVKPNVKSLEIDAEPDPSLEPPAPGMQPVSFQLRHLSERARVTVDSHSSSPAFRHENRALLFALAKIGAASPQQVVAGTHPPNEDAMIEDIEAKTIEQAAFLQAHPELAAKGGGKTKH